MAERERRQTPPFGGVFVSHARIMTTDDMGRAIRRMAHEVIERNHGVEELVVVGLQTGGQSVDPPLNRGGIHQPIFPNDCPPRRCK